MNNSRFLVIVFVVFSSYQPCLGMDAKDVAIKQIEAAEKALEARIEALKKLRDTIDLIETLESQIRNDQEKESSK